MISLPTGCRRYVRLAWYLRILLHRLGRRLLPRRDSPGADAGILLPAVPSRRAKLHVLSGADPQYAPPPGEQDAGRLPVRRQAAAGDQPRAQRPGTARLPLRRGGAGPEGAARRPALPVPPEHALHPPGLRL